MSLTRSSIAHARSGRRGVQRRAIQDADRRRREAAKTDKTFKPTQYSVADFYANKGYFGASFSPDRQKILVGSNTSGIWNAYAVPVAGGELEPLTKSTTNSIFPISYFPGDGTNPLLVRPGRERALASVRAHAPTAAVTDITPGAKLTANFVGWAGDDKSFFITTNERDPRFFDVYEVKTDGLAKTLVYKNTDGYNVAGVSRDKRLPRAREELHDVGPGHLPAGSAEEHGDEHHEAHRDGEQLAGGLLAGRHEAAVRLRQRSRVRVAPQLRPHRRLEEAGLRAELGHHRRELLEERQVSRRRCQRGLEGRRARARCEDARSRWRSPGMPTGLVRGVEVCA